MRQTPFVDRAVVFEFVEDGQVVTLDGAAVGEVVLVHVALGEFEDTIAYVAFLRQSEGRVVGEGLPTQWTPPATQETADTLDETAHDDEEDAFAFTATPESIGFLVAVWAAVTAWLDLTTADGLGMTLYRVNGIG